MNASDHQQRTSRMVRFFNPALLSLYDLIVFQFVSPLIWRVTTRDLVARYQALVSAAHSEAGVGTGYLLTRMLPRKPTEGVDKLGIMDLSANCLHKAARRLQMHQPSCYQYNLLEPMGPAPERFDSIGINFVLHCVPGQYPEKATALGRLKLWLQDGGVLFGSAVVNHSAQPDWLAKLTIKILNAIGIFNNSDDDAMALADGLKREFLYADTRIVGPTVLFVASDNAENFERSRLANQQASYG